MTIWTRGGTVTSEKITPKSTRQQIISNTALRVLVRGIAVVMGLVWAFLAGRWTAVLILGWTLVASVDVVFVRQSITLRPSEKFRQQPKRFIGVLLASVVLLAMALADVWPPFHTTYACYWWMSEVCQARSVFFTTPWGMATLPGWWNWVRIALIGSMPFVFIEPLRVAEWAAMMEQALPKFRELLFGQASPDSVAVPGIGQLNPKGRTPARGNNASQDDPVSAAPRMPDGSPPNWV